MTHSNTERVIADHWRAILQALGYDPADPHFVDTPDRVARFMASWHTNRAQPPKVTTFPNTEHYDEMVATGDLYFYSMCAHHGVPFFGRAAVAYIPSKRGRVVGLSKMARVLDHFANRYTLQERITKEVADFMMAELRPKGVGVVLKAEHLCMSLRGVKKPGHRTVTSSMRGVFMQQAEARQELLTLLSDGGPGR